MFFIQWSGFHLNPWSAQRFQLSYLNTMTATLALTYTSSFEAWWVRRDSNLYWQNTSLQIVECLDYLPPGKKKKYTMTGFRIHCNTFNTILKKQRSKDTKLMEARRLQTQRTNITCWYGGLLQWFKAARANYISITEKILRAKAKEVNS